MKLQISSESEQTSLVLKLFPCPINQLLTHPSPSPCSSWQQKLITCQTTWEADELPELQELFLEVKPGTKLGASSSDEVKKPSAVALVHL